MLSASNEWPQIREGEDHDQRSLNNKNKNKNKMMMMGSKEGEEGKVMEKPSQEQIHQQQQPLKCPRCDSTNTKFCYYNNYSLTQPRHFCKACKRYWTRGGTLRTVPVGGGCRKNKRVRRPPNPHPSSSTTTTNNSSSNTCSTNISEPSSNTLFHLNPSGIGGGGGGGAHLISSPFLYGLPTNLLPPNHHHHSNSSPHEAIINGFPFSSYSESDHHLGGLGLGFSGILGCGDHGGIRNGKQILQDLMISNSNPSFHGSNSNTTTTTNTTTSTTTMPISSLLTSSCLQQQKFNFESLFPYDLDLQIKGVGSHVSEGVYMKEDGVKVEDGDHQSHGQCQIQNGYDQIHDHHHQQQPPMGESQDPSMLWNNNNNNTNGNSIGVNWLDPNNYSSIGSSSVPSLI